MQKLFVHILAILRRVLPGIGPASKTGGRPDVISPPQSYRQRQVFPAAQPNVYLRLLSDTTPLKRGKLGALLGASLGTLVIAGFTGPAMGQAGEEACAFVMELRSPYTVERILRQFPNDPCVPIMLAAIPSHLLRRIDVDLIQDLPASQLRKVPGDVLEEIGISSTRGVSRTYRDDDDDEGGY